MLDSIDLTALTCIALMFFLWEPVENAFDRYASNKCVTMKGDSAGWCMQTVKVNYHGFRASVCEGLVVEMEALRSSRMKGHWFPYHYYIVESASGGNKSIDCGLIVSSSTLGRTFRWALLSPVEDDALLDHVSKFVVQKNVSTEDIRLVTYNIQMVAEFEKYAGLICLMLLFSACIFYSRGGTEDTGNEKRRELLEIIRRYLKKNNKKKDKKKIIRKHQQKNRKNKKKRRH